MKPVCGYMTYDGKLFSNIDEAIQHESCADIVGELVERIKDLGWSNIDTSKGRLVEFVSRHYQIRVRNG